MKKTLSLLASFVPAFLLAAEAPLDTAARTVDGLLNKIIYFAGRALPLLILAALVLFLFGIVKRFFWAKDTADKGEAGRYILWGVVALFVMVSVWGLVNVLRGTFNLDNNNVPLAPAVPCNNAPKAGMSTINCN